MILALTTIRKCATVAIVTIGTIEVCYAGEEENDLFERK